MSSSRWSLALLALLALLACVVNGGAVAADLPYAAAVAARFAEPAVRYDTPGLRDGRETFTRNDELLAALRALAAAPKGPRLVVAGRSQSGVAIEALHFSSGPGRPAVLLVGQQHGDEPAGAEALLALAQQLAQPLAQPHSQALAGADLALLLQKVDVIVLPRANPDGAELDVRRAANGLDINRDHLLLRTPEAQAQGLLMREFNPLVVVDLHEHTVVGRYLDKFGALQRNDLLLQYAMTANLPPAITRASEEWFRQPMLQALKAEGLTADWYYTNTTNPTDLRLSMGGAQPDTARNVHGLKNTISILLESRGVGIGRLHLQRRVHSHVVALKSILASAAAHADALVALKRDADAKTAANACTGDVVVLAAQTVEQREILMLDPVTGADKTVSVQWFSSLALRPVVTRPRPCGYWLAAGAENAVQRLRALGVQVQRLRAATALQAEIWRETSRVEGTRPDVRGALDDGYAVRLVQVAQESMRLGVPAGSWYVSLAQPLALLAVAALEPDSPNSFFANHVLADLAAAARVTAPPPAESLL